MVTMPSGGWSVTPDRAKLAESRMGTQRLNKLRTTGLLALRVPKLEPIEVDTFRWHSEEPDLSRSDATWVIDGSAFNTTWSGSATFGFAIVVTSNSGSRSLLAWASSTTALCLPVLAGCTFIILLPVTHS